MSKTMSLSIFNCFALVGLLCVLFYTEDIICLTVFTASYFGWESGESSFYMSYLKSKWNKLPEVEAEPVPELHLSNYSRAEMLRLTDNLRHPIVIRGAVKDSKACKLWNEKYFVNQYGDETVVVREMFEETNIRMQHRTFKEFYSMKNKGRNVSIVASSAIFNRNKVFKSDLRSVIEDDLVGPNKEPIIAQQFFITPGGRSWYHSAVGNNVFRQIAGRKRWTLISPDKNFWMCPAPVISGTSVNPCLAKLPTDEREAWIKRIPRITALLEPGDILINGGWWWHDVQSYGTTNDQMISVAGRIKNLKGTFFNSPIQTIFALATIIISGKGKQDEAKYELTLEENIVYMKSAYTIQFFVDKTV